MDSKGRPLDTSNNLLVELLLNTDFWAVVEGKELKTSFPLLPNRLHGILKDLHALDLGSFNTLHMTVSLSQGYDLGR